MKRIFILTLALWTGTASFAYASARSECATGMDLSAPSAPVQKIQTSHACCGSSPCRCAVENGANREQAPARTAAPVASDPLSAQAFVDLPSSAASTEAARFVSRSGPPPKHPPLYELFSVYRI